MTHEEARLALGALALGALDDAEATEVRAHVDTCAACAAELDELRGLPALLGLVTAAEVAAGPASPTAAGEVRLLQAVADERRAKQRRGLASMFAGSLALAAAAAVIGFVVAEGAADEPAPPDFTLAATDDATGVWAAVALNDVGWGTKIELEMSGATAGEHCRLVAFSATGQKTASDWTVPSDVDDYLTVPGAVGFHPSEIDYFDVLTDDDQLLVRIDLDTLP